MNTQNEQRQLANSVKQLKQQVGETNRMFGAVLPMNRESERKSADELVAEARSKLNQVCACFRHPIIHRMLITVSNRISRVFNKP